MLDDLKLIHQKDKQDLLGVAEKQWQQYQHKYDFSWQPEKPVSDVVLAGMGGSGLAAEAFKGWASLAVPVELVRGYELPYYVHVNTLLVLLSYSGNTEEMVAVLEQAISHKDRPMIVVIATGGQLLEIAREHNLPYVELPNKLLPRTTFGYQLRALCTVFEQTTLLPGALTKLSEAGEWLHEQTKAWLPTVKANPAKQLALECIGKSVVVYSGPLLAAAAHKWKIAFNENAKQVAWWNTYPELNHNELTGWTAQPIDKPYAVIELRSALEHPRVQKRFAVTERLLSGMRPAPHILEVQGKSQLQQLLWAAAFADFVSIYCGLLNGVDPAAEVVAHKLKKGLNDE